MLFGSLVLIFPGHEMSKISMNGLKAKSTEVTERHMWRQTHEFKYLKMSYFKQITSVD